ncbi:MAG: hypothetical protein IKX97_02605 [Erysipelotrichaceae bacterium]|nr:hypothetical protein [Erysipelotrichaceae bacterium]
MIRKIIVILLVLMCVSCAAKDDADTFSEEYIDPVKDVFIFSELDRKLQDRIYDAAGREPGNYQLKMLFRNIYDGVVEDIYGNLVSISDHDKVFLEIVSTKCSHCKNQLSMMDDFLSKEDVQFVQYFNVGDSEEIIGFYDEAGVEISDDVIIIPKNDELKEYIRDYLGVEMYPTLVSFLNGKVAFVTGGEIDAQTFEKIYDISFTDPLKPEDFIDEDGNNIVDRDRTAKDVEKSLSAHNLEMLRSLDNDDMTYDLTLTVIGSPFDFDTVSNSKSSAYINEVEDFGEYKDRQLIVIYTYLRDNSETDKVEFINSLIDEENGYEYVVVLYEGLESSSAALQNMDVGFRCPVVSMNSDVPDDLGRVHFDDYPSAAFIDRGTFTGVYSNIKNVQDFNEALELFLGDGCIAYKRNN